MPKCSLTFFFLGELAYGKAWKLQESLHARVAGGEIAPCVLLLEHSPVVTLGRHAQAAYLRASPDELAMAGVELHHSDRGGEVTAHMPGQLVVYPILPLQDFKLLPRQYIFMLEQCIIDLLRGYGLNAQRDPKHPGVWVQEAKIAAVGVRIKRRTSLHGIALNVSNSLALFEQMIPCGIHARGVTSIAALSGQHPPIAHIAWQLAQGLAAQLAVANWHWARQEELAVLLGFQEMGSSATPSG